ncbi:predicted protein [Botrytis cinerea T4]|uniref:Uncharacterized protein n=1 Tax=Botryotinia fuckeliana (strain T4) TaxID=999810 RepID=G2XU78_BOTF4|nr:predicted protein [Botrytis cinerea T4]
MSLRQNLKIVPESVSPVATAQYLWFEMPPYLQSM